MYHLFKRKYKIIFKFLYELVLGSYYLSNNTKIVIIVGTKLIEIFNIEFIEDQFNMAARRESQPCFGRHVKPALPKLSGREDVTVIFHLETTCSIKLFFANLKFIQGRFCAKTYSAELKRNFR